MYIQVIALQSERDSYRAKYFQTKKCLTEVVKTSAEKDIIIKQKTKLIKTLRNEIDLIKSTQENKVLTFTEANNFNEDQIKFLVSIPGDAPSDYKFTREVIRFLFATWESIPTQSLLKAVRPSLLRTIQTMLMDRITHVSRNPSELTERSKKERLSKLISNSLHAVKADGEYALIELIEVTE